VKKIIIGSRGSKLALVQAELVAAQLREVNPGLEVVIHKVVTQGDTNHHTQFNHIADTGIFVRELETALLSKEADLAVHSLKDMPTIIPEGLSLAAVTERLDTRDVLITNGRKLKDLPAGAVIGTGSFRRSAELLNYRPDLKVKAIRGNVDTRIQKALSGEIDGVMLAASAMKRLGWEDRITEYLPSEHFLPEIGQGALGIETRANDKETLAVVAHLNHQPTWYSIVAERAFLTALGGGCRAPIACLATVQNGKLKLDGLVGDTKGRRIIRESAQGKATDAEQIGLGLGRKMMGMGALELINEARTDD
jgi:hydroxymethylbilane synthase